MRLYKQIIIPAEMVRSRGEKTECFSRIKAKGIIKWKIKFPQVNKPTIKAKRS